MSFFGGLKRALGWSGDDEENEDYISYESSSDKQVASQGIKEEAEANESVVLDFSDEIPEGVFDGLIDQSTGVTTLDIAKRLLDYGFHAPTIYFPLLFHQSIMIEPTETESKETLDGFIEIMKHIAAEAIADPESLKTAPHTTPVRRLDETTPARQPVLRFCDM